MIFILDFDPFDMNINHYEIKEYVDNSELCYSDGVHHLYFNTVVKDSSGLSKLLQYIADSDPNNDDFGALSQQVIYHKKQSEEVGDMCKAVEEYAKPSESEVAENNTPEDNSHENNSEIDKVIINPENSSDTNSENVSENNSDNTETEVLSMPNLFKSLLSRGDDDEELDLEFDINSPEADCFELPPDRRDNQVLAVCGSPSSGKTIMSVKLARYIASQKKNVILVIADMSAPLCPTFARPPISRRKPRSAIFSAQLMWTEILFARTRSSIRKTNTSPCLPC